LSELYLKEVKQLSLGNSAILVLQSATIKWLVALLGTLLSLYSPAETGLKEHVDELILEQLIHPMKETQGQNSELCAYPKPFMQLVLFTKWHSNAMCQPT